MDTKHYIWISIINTFTSETLVTIVTPKDRVKSTFGFYSNLAKRLRGSGAKNEGIDKNFIRTSFSLQKGGTGNTEIVCGRIKAIIPGYLQPEDLDILSDHLKILQKIKIN